ncbi:MAG TPA: MATE family efflux transporter [Chitinophagaceae bacterium]|nr:MATE family efflux transporter [Chitinophagaceae bacterium]
MADFTVNTNLKVHISNRQILSIALPITLALIVPQINFITNNIFLGKLGEKELGNAGITGVYYLIVAVIGNGLNNAMQSLISRKAGEDNIEGIGKLLSQGIRISLQFALGGILFTWFIAPLCLKPFANPDNFQQEINFLRIRVLGLPFLYLFQMGNALLIGTLHSRLLMIGFVIESFANIFFDYSLIFGNFGLPKMGFNGAALASVLAEMVGLCVVTLVIFSKGLKKRFHLFKTFQYDKQATQTILKISAPLILQYIISLTTWFIFFLMIEQQYSERDKAISNVMRNVFGVTGIFSWAFASTSNTMVSNLIGQGKVSEVLYAIKRIMILSFGSCVLIALLLNLFPSVFLSLFSKQTNFLNDAIPVMRMVSIGMLCMSIAAVWLNGLTGTGQTKINLTVEVAAIIGYCIYTYIIMKILNLPIHWAWSNEIVYWAVIFTVSFFFLARGKWKERL